MPNYNTITGNVAPVSETAVTLASLIYAISGFRDMPRRLTNGTIINKGTVAIEIAYLQDDAPDTAPTANHFIEIEADGSDTFEYINIYKTWIRTTDDTGTNKIQFSATPTDTVG